MPALRAILGLLEQLCGSTNSRPAAAHQRGTACVQASELFDSTSCSRPCPATGPPRCVCDALRIDRSLYHYKGKRGEQADLKLRIKQICETRVRMAISTRRWAYNCGTRCRSAGLPSGRMFDNGISCAWVQTARPPSGGRVKGSDLIDRGSAARHEPGTHPMARLQVELLPALVRHGAQVGAEGGFCDRLGVVVVGLLALHEGLHIDR